MIRPKVNPPSEVMIHDFYEGIDKHNGNGLDFDDSQEDRIAALFHTGGTTGLPKLAQHKQSGMIYNGWCGKLIGITSDEVIICPLPLFHVFAAYPILMSGIRTGAHIVFPTPAGYRGDKVFDLFWNLVEKMAGYFHDYSPHRLVGSDAKTNQGGYFISPVSNLWFSAIANRIVQQVRESHWCEYHGGVWTDRDHLHRFG